MKNLSVTRKLQLQPFSRIHNSLSTISRTISPSCDLQVPQPLQFGQQSRQFAFQKRRSLCQFVAGLPAGVAMTFQQTALTKPSRRKSTFHCSSLKNARRASEPLDSVQLSNSTKLRSFAVVASLEKVSFVELYDVRTLKQVIFRCLYW